MIYGGEVVLAGYAIPVEVNAKNRLGGYTGFQEWACLYDRSGIRQCMLGDIADNPLIHPVR
jgi:hypothetical protein